MKTGKITMLFPVFAAFNAKAENNSPLFRNSAKEEKALHKAAPSLWISTSK